MGVLHGGADTIRNHNWYKGSHWDLLLKGTMFAPIINKDTNSKKKNNKYDREFDQDF